MGEWEAEPRALGLSLGALLEQEARDACWPVPGTQLMGGVASVPVRLLSSNLMVLLLLQLRGDLGPLAAMRKQWKQRLENLGKHLSRTWKRNVPRRWKARPLSCGEAM